MKHSSLIFFLTFLISIPISAQIILPDEVLIFEGEIDFEIQIFNPNDVPLSFEIQHEFRGFEEWNNGEFIDFRSFEVEDASDRSYKSVCYDRENDYLWWDQYNPPMITVFDLSNEYEEVASLELNAPNPQDMAWLNGVVYTMNWSGDSTIQRYTLNDDNEIERMEDLKADFEIYGIASDHMENWLVLLELSEPDHPLHFYTLDDDGNLEEDVGVVDNWRRFVDNQHGYNLEFVPEHAGAGQIWNQRQGNMHQVQIDTEEFEAVESDNSASFRVHSTQWYEGAAHDGHDLWVVSYSNTEVIAYNDGVNEDFNILYDITEGIIELESDTIGISFSSSAGDARAGIYRYRIKLRIEHQERRYTREIPFVLIKDMPIVSLSGEVYDSQSGELIENVWVELTDYRMYHQSDSSGSYEFDTLPLKPLTFIFRTQEHFPDTLLFVPQEEGDYEIDIELQPLLSVDSDEPLPHDIELLSIYPNPFNNWINVSLSSRFTSPVNIDIYNVAGRKLTGRSLSVTEVGNHSYRFDMSEFATGVYLLRFEQSDRITDTRKLVLLK